MKAKINSPIQGNLITLLMEIRDFLCEIRESKFLTAGGFLKSKLYPVTKQTKPCEVIMDNGFSFDNSICDPINHI